MSSKRVLIFIFFFAAWLFLLWPFSPLNIQDITAGVLVCFSAVLLFTDKKGAKEWRYYFNPVRYFWAVVYVVFLYYYLLIAVVEIILSVLKPEIKEDSRVEKFGTKLKNPQGRALLCNSVTLFPGTLSVEMKNENLHIQYRKFDIKKTNARIRKIEKVLKKVFE